jgi:hypothetical protein
MSSPITTASFGRVLPLSGSNAGSNATSLANTAVALATGAITPQGLPCRDSRYSHPALVAPLARLSL